MKQSTNLFKRFPVIAFYVLAFAISWIGWLPQALYARGMFPFDNPLLSLLGAGGPTLAAVIVLMASGQRDKIGRLFGALFQFKASPIWYLFAFGFWFAVGGIALLFLGMPVSALGSFAWVSLPGIFLMMVFSNVWEEIGWRGFALPRLQEKYGDLVIVVLMGLLWNLWHLPLLLNPDSPMADLPWYGEIVFSLALTVIYIWLYLHTKRSLFFVTVFHAMSNTIAFVLLELGVFVSSYLYVVGITAVFAIGIIARYGVKRFSSLAEFTPNR